MACLHKWYHCDQQEMGQLQEDQELLMVDVLNLRDSIGRENRDEGAKD